MSEPQNRASMPPPMSCLRPVTTYDAGMKGCSAWKKPGVPTTEAFDPDPFMDPLNKWGLPWKESFTPDLVD